MYPLFQEKTRLQFHNARYQLSVHCAKEIPNVFRKEDKNRMIKHYIHTKKNRYSFINKYISPSLEFYNAREIYPFSGILSPFCNFDSSNLDYKIFSNFNYEKFLFFCFNWFFFFFFREEI